MLFWPGVILTGPYLNFRCCTPGCSGAFTTVAFASLLGMAEVEVSSFVDDDFAVVDGAAFGALSDERARVVVRRCHRPAIITTARTGATIATTHVRHDRRVLAAFLSFRLARLSPSVGSHSGSDATSCTVRAKTTLRHIRSVERAVDDRRC